MSLFDYKCTECKHLEEDVIEVWTPTPAPKVCPKCLNATLIRKDFYQTWFSLGGSGWTYSGANCKNSNFGDRT